MPNPWTCRITPSLPHELAAIAGDVAPTNGKAAQSAGFPGVLLSVEDRPVAALGFEPDSGSALSISDPVFFTSASTEVRSLWFRQMLQEVQQEAAQEKRFTIRSVQPACETNRSPWMEDALKDCGFSVRTQIICWRAAATDSQQTGSPLPAEQAHSSLQYQQVQASSLDQNAKQRHVLTQLVQLILTETQDLKSLSAPSAEAMIKEWIAESALITIAEHHAAASGLCVCVTEPTEVPPSATADSAETLIRIQYIGVRPESRQLGIASQMLVRLPAALRQCPGISTKAKIDLAAFTDQNNEAALSLYRRCGFKSTTRFNLWVRTFDGS